MFCLILLVLGTVVDFCKTNPPIYPSENYHDEFFQGDIYLRNGSLTWDKFATTQKTLRWPNKIVPYIFDDIYTESEKELMRSAMAEFEEKTCIKWVERTDEDSYVEIYSDMGCWSELGRIGGVQSLSLESPLCMKKGAIMHEMMHSLGFLHEQSRPDRDDHVRVMWDNIISGMEPNFEKLSPLVFDDLGLSYDYSSIMHYRAYMFAQDRSEPTLMPVDHQANIDDLGAGQRDAEFTDLDLQKIKKFYEC
ncbi:zinc metalloproteinase nas-15 [Parasteatoda tepidariorum]|uniref:zinc metalloproteinase nas-15 n=1 Tax=Parasteatoda tepidariorum TaxID=114398 RepID=UPI0039BC4B46